MTIVLTPEQEEQVREFWNEHSEDDGGMICFQPNSKCGVLRVSLAPKRLMDFLVTATNFYRDTLEEGK